MSSPNEWLVPFRGRNHSGATTQNFLWRHENVYVMDNHRAAMWCWLRELGESQPVGLLHIDEHYDTLYSRMDEWLSALPKQLARLSIHDYLALEHRNEHGISPLIRWDNYLSLFLELYWERVEKSIFATHGQGDEPRRIHPLLPPPRQLPGNIEFWLEGDPVKWIANIDLDYFFCNQGNKRKPMFSDAYVDAVFSSIRRCRESGKIACLTLCLTPDESYTGGWGQAEALCAQACAVLGVPFQLPPEPARRGRGRQASP